MCNQVHLLLRGQSEYAAANAMRNNTTPLLCNQGRAYTSIHVPAVGKPSPPVMDNPRHGYSNAVAPPLIKAGDMEYQGLSPSRKFPPSHHHGSVSPKKGKRHCPSTKEQQVKDKGTSDEKIPVYRLVNVRHQRGHTCVFHATAYYLEWYMLKYHRKRVEIDIEWFVHDYTTMVKVPFGYDRCHRVVAVLNMCRDQGVIATSCDDSKKHFLVCVPAYECIKMNESDYSFEMSDAATVFKVLDKNPLLGTIPVGEDFKNLGSRIYDTDRQHPKYFEYYGTHLVLFVSYGHDNNGRPYLVFLNSYGEKWGDNGLGSIYFDNVFQLEHDKGFRFIKLKDIKYKEFCSSQPTICLQRTHEPNDKRDLHTQVPSRSYPGKAYGHMEQRSAPDDWEMLDESFRHDISTNSHFSIIADELHTPLYESGPAIAKAKKEDAAKEGDHTRLTEAYHVKKYEARQKEQARNSLFCSTVEDFDAKFPAGATLQFVDGPLFLPFKHVSETAPLSHVINQYHGETELYNTSKLGVEKKYCISGLQKINPGDELRSLTCGATTSNASTSCKNDLLFHVGHVNLLESHMWNDLHGGGVFISPKKVPKTHGEGI